MKLIIFDCDGTLVDSQHAIVSAMNGAFELHGLAAPPRERVLSIVGLSLPQAVARLLPEAEPKLVHAISESYKGSFKELRHATPQEEPLYPGAREAIRDLAGRTGVSLGIATGKSRRGVKRLFDQEGWHPHFATIQTAEDAPSKPHPAMIEQAMAEVGASARNTVMIGDTSFDMEMARAAGVHALGVGWGYHPVPELHAAGAHHVASDYPDVLAIIERVVGIEPSRAAARQKKTAP